MAYETQTLEELEDLIRAGVRGRIPGVDTSPGSDEDIRAKSLAVAVHGNQSQGDYLSKQVTPKNAEQAFLEQHAAARGLSRLPAAPASGRCVITATTEPHTQLAGSTATHGDGSTYTLRSDAEIAAAGWSVKNCGPECTRSRIFVSPDVSGMAADDVVEIGGVVNAIKEVLAGVNAIDLYSELPAAPSSGTVITPKIGAVAIFDADEDGASGNKNAGDTVTLDTPAHGDVTAAMTVLEMSGGGDQETWEELRQRVLDFMAERPGTGNKEDVREYTLATPGVRLAEAFVYPGRRGLGTVDVVPMGVAGARLVGVTPNAAILSHLQSELSFMDDVAVVQWTLMATGTNVSLLLVPATGYEPDWVGTFTTEVAAHTTSRIFLTADPTDTIEVGDRIQILVTSAGRRVLNHRRVRAVVTGGTHYVDVDAPLDGTPDPAGGETMYPGGPLVDTVKAAVETLFDSLGPGSGFDTRHPDEGVSWAAQLSTDSLIHAVRGVTGVKKVTVDLPLADVTPVATHRAWLDELVIEHT